MKRQDHLARRKRAVLDVEWPDGGRSAGASRLVGTLAHALWFPRILVTLRSFFFAGAAAFLAGALQLWPSASAAVFAGFASSLAALAFGFAFMPLRSALPALAVISATASSTVSACGSVPLGSVALTLPQLTWGRTCCRAR